MPIPVTALIWDDEAGGLVEMPIYGAEPEPEPVRRSMRFHATLLRFKQLKQA
jgi:hypothetical protein